MNVDGPRAPVIAIGAATVAVVMSLIALVVVVARSPKGSELGAAPFETAVAASDVLELKRDVVEIIVDHTQPAPTRVDHARVR